MLDRVPSTQVYQYPFPQQESLYGISAALCLMALGRTRVSFI